MANLKVTGLIAVTALALAGCEGPTGIWSRDGSSQYQSTLDQRGCLRESNDYGFLSGNPGPTIIIGSGGNQAGSNSRNDLYRMCMNSRGYAKVVETDEE
jgi:hypothetical protein